MTEGANQGKSSTKPGLAPSVQRRQRMEGLGVKEEKSPGIVPNRQVASEFKKLTMKEQAPVLMSRRNFNEWLAKLTLLGGAAAAITRRIGPGAMQRIRWAMQNLHDKMFQWQEVIYNISTRSSDGAKAANAMWRTIHPNITRVQRNQFGGNAEYLRIKIQGSRRWIEANMRHAEAVLRYGPREGARVGEVINTGNLQRLSEMQRVMQRGGGRGSMQDAFNATKNVRSRIKDAVQTPFRGASRARRARAGKMSDEARRRHR